MPASRPRYPFLLSNIVFLKRDGAASWCDLAYFLPGQIARTTPRRFRNRCADSGAMSGRPIFCYAFAKVDDSAVFADSAAPSKRPSFCHTIVKVADSADSANIDCVVTADSMAIPIRPIFCGLIEDEATSLFMSGDSADSADSAAASRRLIFLPHIREGRRLRRLRRLRSDVRAS